MSIAYDYDSATRTLTARPQGKLTTPAIREYFVAVIGDASVGSVKFEVVHFEGVTDFAFTYSETHGLEKQYSAMRDSTGIELTLFLAPEDVQFGIARMFASILGDKLPAIVVRDQAGLDAACRGR